ncbi:c-type cytochrome [Campylobacter sp. VicNov18]|uniref:cbb3-type cytochrome c oxidase N-terminal domain-containing protein n=1 Tax=Campylobacter bilis TaxID=2691918 RepID=UPI00130ED60D|nr:cbb3-type cytochrome c oxidase N-terminal domain-containing protein [Campylobacter bilis]MPV63955.1 c-type cytochrome [Campylobacter hepaticus]MBM0637456.1 c-type cytochrome [Campylobacter bilis]MCC8278175.1 c-type cytochrome [Campylobacter bilis]MCC8299679.1 c-type cytochrome [Campylobacter bilis]MCC8301084.1 c-type cytochrome [Campylobacter bilis]
MQWLNLEDNVNLLSLIGAILIILITLVIVSRMFKEMKEKKEKSELSDHSWDGIEEYKNPIPTGWAIVFLLTIIWVIWYFLWGYPLNSFSSIGQYNEEVAVHDAKFKEKFKDLSVEDKIVMGQNIFLVQCSVCHGITGDGINGKAQNLNLWGSEEGLVEVIKKGSKGMNFPGGEMPGASDLGIAEEDILAIAAYVAKELSAIKKTANEDLVARGKQAYGACAACHGEDGKGQDGLFPDLTKYGSAAFVVDVLHSGKAGFIGTMPSFSGLNDIQKEAVGEYVISLSRGE